MAVSQRGALKGITAAIFIALSKIDGEQEMHNPEDDAKGQYAPSQADRKANGVLSAKPTVVTGSEDATVHRDPPGKKAGKNFDPNYDPTGRDKASDDGGE